MTGRCTLKILARNKEDFAVRIAGIPDGNLRDSVAPAPCQQDDIGVLEKDEQLVIEPE